MVYKILVSAWYVLNLSVCNICAFAAAAAATVDYYCYYYYYYYYLKKCTFTPSFNIPYKRNRLPTWVFHKEGQIFTPRGKHTPRSKLNAYKRGLILRYKRYNVTVYLHVTTGISSLFFAKLLSAVQIQCCFNCFCVCISICVCFEYNQSTDSTGESTVPE